MEKKKISEIAGKAIIEDNDKLLIFDEANQSLKLASSTSIEKISNKKQTLTDSETDYPSGKAVTDELNVVKADISGLSTDLERAEEAIDDETQARKAADTALQALINGL